MALLSHLLGWAVRETLNVSCISTSKCYSNTLTCTHSLINPHTSNAIHTHNMHRTLTSASVQWLCVYESGCIFDTCPFDEVTEGEFKADPEEHEPIPDPIQTAVTERQAAYLLLNFTRLQLCLTLNVPCLTNTSAFLYLPLEESLYSSMTMLCSAL